MAVFTIGELLYTLCVYSQDVTVDDRISVDPALAAF
jgi:hypothetical protein